jgi:glycosyltransferase involved in cell wall biosynthesis
VDIDVFKFFPNVDKCHEIELCFLGRISPEKGVEKVIEVVDILHKEGYDVHLKLIGRFWPRYRNYFHKIMGMANERNYISKNIGMPFSELPLLVGNSDALVFPISETEPLALAPLEAMACGTPVISFKRAAAVEYVFDGVNGFLTNDLSEMVDAVLRLKEIDRRMCRNIVEKNFSVDSMYRSYMEKYEKVIELAQ